MKKTLLTLALLTFGLIAVKTTYASYGSVACQPIYGGGETCATADKVTLDKKVMNPATGTKGMIEAYVDNLSINDPKYLPDQTVKFQLTVTNVSNSVLSEVDITDTLPSYINFASGPGSYDKNKRVLTIKVMNLNPNESRTYTVAAKVADISKLPMGQGNVCVVNQASAVFESDQSMDNSAFCISENQPTTKGGLPIYPAPTMSQTPATGPEMLPLLGLIPTAGFGLLLRRKSK